MGCFRSGRVCERDDGPLPSSIGFGSVSPTFFGLDLALGFKLVVCLPSPSSPCSDPGLLTVLAARAASRLLNASALSRFTLARVALIFSSFCFCVISQLSGG